MLNIGDRVIINISTLDIGGLSQDNNTSNKDYHSYILGNKGREYTISEVVAGFAPYVLDDAFLNSTSFNEDELLLVK